MNGWFKFHRTMLDHAVWSLSEGQLKVWVTCLALANIQPKEWWDGRERTEIPAGSFITSQDHLAKAAKLSRRIVRGALTNLERIGSIRAKARANRWTLIEVVNWPLYQGTGDAQGQEEGQPRAN